MTIGAFIFCIICFLGVTIFYLLFQRKKYQPGANQALARFYKGTATLFAAALSLYGALHSPSHGNALLAVGLLVCAAADVILDILFLPGMALFGLGHIFYCAAYLLKSPPTAASLGIFLILAGICACLYPRLKKLASGQNLLPFLCYGFILFLMLALAVVQKPVLLAGAFLFVVSDCLLAYRIFTKNQSLPLDYTCLGCYYLAQYLIALSSLF